MSQMLPSFLFADLAEAALLPRSEFTVGSVSLGVRSYSPSIEREILRFFGRYSLSAARAENGQCWELFVYPPHSLRAFQQRMDVGQRVHQSSLYPGVSFDVFDLDGQLVVCALGDHHAIVDFQHRVVVCCAPENTDQIRTRSMVNTLVVPALNEILARQRQFLLHCASLELRSRGVLIAASSGRGKTTAALALLEHGFGLVSDDLTLLDANVTPPLFRGIARDVRICPDSLALFPRLHFLSGRPLDSGKVAAPIDELSPSGPVVSVPAALLLFPVESLPLGGADAVKITAGEAIEHLVPHSMFVAGQYRFEYRFMALLNLLENTRSYLFRQHLNVKMLPGIVENLLHDIHSGRE